MATLSEEFVFTVPADMVRSCSTGLSIDFGSSAVKCVYRTSEDFEEVKSAAQMLGHLHGVTFLRTDFEAGLDFVLQRVLSDLLSDSRGENSPQMVLNITGVGSREFSTILSQALNVTLQVKSEYDCVAKAFYHLTSVLSRSQLLEPFSVEAVTGAVAFIRTVMMMMVHAKENGTDFKQVRPTLLDGNINETAGIPPAAAAAAAAAAVESEVDIPLCQAEDDVFPCLMVNIGSCFFSVKIAEDGTFSAGDYSTGGGRLMMGIANYLVGCKTFDEFITLASNGNSYNVDQWIHDLVGGAASENKDRSMYDEFEDTMASFLVFSMGKAIGANTADFRREDLARSWLEYVIQDCVRAIFLNCYLYGLRRVFFIGGLASHPLARRLVSQEMARRNLHHQFDTEREPIQFDFIKAGHHFVALGCLAFDMNGEK